MAMRTGALYALTLLVLSASAAAQPGTWSLADSVSPITFRAVDCADPEYCMATGNGLGDYGSQFTRKSTDGGRTWFGVISDTLIIRQVSPDSIYLYSPLRQYDIAYPHRRFAYATCDSGIVLRTRDGGASWGRVQLPFNTRLRMIAAYDSLHAIVLNTSPESGNWFYITEDGFDTRREFNLTALTKEYFPQYGSMTVLDIAMPSKDTIFAIGGYGSNTNFFVASYDGGRNWKISEGLHRVYGLCFINSKVGWAVGGIPTDVGQRARDIVYRTTDAGQSWELQVDRENEPAFGLLYVDFADEHYGMAAGSSSKVLFTSNGGKDWSVFKPVPPLQPSEVITGIAYPSINTATVTSFTHCLFHFTGAISAVREPETEGIVPELWASPNPVSDQVEIRCRLPQPGPMRLLLYNTLGMCCRVLHDTHSAETETTVRLERGTLAAGLYIVRLESSGSPGSLKLLIL